VIDLDGVPGQTQIDVLAVIGPIFVESGDVADQATIDAALDTIVNATVAEAADPDAV